jgi:YbbR domain-containing protein
MASRTAILHNFWWKLLSLVTAALLWLIINIVLQKNEQEMVAAREVETESRRPFYGIPITVLASPSNTNRFSITPDLVSVDVGSKDSKALDDLQAHQVQAFVDVSDAEDEKQFRRPVQIHVPPDFVVVAMAPTNASVERISSPR